VLYANKAGETFHLKKNSRKTPVTTKGVKNDFTNDDFTDAKKQQQICSIHIPESKPTPFLSPSG